VDGIVQMSEYSTEEKEAKRREREVSAEKLVFVMPDHALRGAAAGEITVKELWDVFWEGKWLFIAIVTVFVLGSVAYALLATEWYRSTVLLAPTKADSMPSISGQLGGLAALAGVSVAGVGGGESAEAVATLESRDLAREFIESNELIPVLLDKDGDNFGQELKVTAGKEETPDIRDAVRVFHEKILKVREDRETGLITVSVEWVDPHLAAEWASKVVRLTNDRLRRRALADAERNVAYLQSEMSTTSVVALQQSISRLLEAEMQKLMLAKKNDEFAFRTVDAAEPAKRPSRPRRVSVVLTGALLGGAIAVFLVFVRRAFLSDRFD
jgi:uncharacterized protein involved in exopolysaccharide biosynthesis